MRSALDVIDRVPAIQINQEDSEMKTIEGDISFRNVSFFFPLTQDAFELECFNLTIHPGMTTVVVGDHKCGSAALVALLLRFYDCADGSVCINNVPLKRLNLMHYRC